MKIIWSGLESSGKSLKLAMVVVDLVERNSKWYAKQKKDFEESPETFATKYNRSEPYARPIASNLRFSDDFYEWSVSTMGVPIQYWQNLEDLEKLEQCDVIIDEVGNYFDSRMWSELSLDVRRWLTQGAKSGIEIYGSAQDFAQIDKAFRRLVNHLFHVTKLIGSRRPSNTMPPVKRIWGVCSVKQLDPMGYDEDKSKFAPVSLIPSFYFIRREYCEIFDTTQKIQRSKPYPYKHIERFCERPEYKRKNNKQ